MLVLVGVLALGACRLDVTVDLMMNADGTGELVVVATVDADVVAQVPGLQGSLRLDDATAAGWVVEGPTDVEGGGLTVTIRRPFTSAAEASNLLNSLGPPFQGVVLDRVVTEDDITTTLTGALTLTGGFDGFGDANLLAAAGSTPFRAQLDQSGATPTESMSVEFTLTTPGNVEESTGDQVDGGVRWAAPLDGSSADLSTRIALGPESGSSWAGPVATVALVLLAVWLVAGLFVGYRVWTARNRRRHRPITRYR
jgi:hypothetical protein